MSFENKEMTKVLIFGGKTGWIGGKMHEYCKEKGRNDARYYFGRKRIGCTHQLNFLLVPHCRH